MLLPSCHQLVSRCPWRQTLLRPFVFLHRRHLTSAKQQRDKDLRRFNHKGRGDLAVCPHPHPRMVVIVVVKESVYSLVVVTGVVALGSLCYVILHEFYSRETPNGIYHEASQLCLANSDVSDHGRRTLQQRPMLQVQDALGVPIVVHTTPDVDATRLNNVR